MNEIDDPAIAELITLIEKAAFHKLSVPQIKIERKRLDKCLPAILDQLQKALTQPQTTPRLAHHSGLNIEKLCQGMKNKPLLKKLFVALFAIHEEQNENIDMYWEEATWDEHEGVGSKVTPIGRIIHEHEHDLARINGMDIPHTKKENLRNSTRHKKHKLEAEICKKALRYHQALQFVEELISGCPREKKDGNPVHYHMQKLADLTESKATITIQEIKTFLQGNPDLDKNTSRALRAYKMELEGCTEDKIYRSCTKSKQKSDDPLNIKKRILEWRKKARQVLRPWEFS